MTRIGAFMTAALFVSVATQTAAARETVSNYKKTTHPLQCEVNSKGLKGFIVVKNTTGRTIPMHATIEIRMKVPGTLPYVEKRFVRVSDQLKNPKTAIAPGEGAWMLYHPKALACWAYVNMAPRVSR